MDEEPTQVNPEVASSPTKTQTALQKLPIKRHHLERFKSWYTGHKKISIPATLLIVLLVALAIPYSRPSILGLFLKEDVSVYVYSDKSGAQLLGANVKLDGQSAPLNYPFTFHHVKLGRHKLLVSAPNHQTVAKTQTIDLTLHKPKKLQVRLTATGLLSQIEVDNKISGQPVVGANVKYKSYVAQTDARGVANLVVGVNDNKINVEISAKGYNTQTQEMSAAETGYLSTIQKASLTPAGKVYFLSKLSGKIDIVKTDLDGSNRETVVAGTGSEDDTNTVLLASRDWKYLALLSNRDGAQKLYVINTSDDKLITMDQGNASFTPVGWYNHYFVYTLSRSGLQPWQPNAASIKSYNAESGQSISLVSTNASGSSTADAQYESLGYSLLMGDDVIYTKTWYQYPGYLNVSGKQNVLGAIKVDGTNARQIKTTDAGNSYFSNLRLAKPHELDFAIYSSASGASTTYWVLDKTGNVSQSSTLDDQKLLTEATSYLASPSYDKTFWADERDGKNVLFVGDSEGNGGQQIATLTDYSTYGWYSDNYLLVSKNSSELYIMSASGIKKDSDAIKITDYHKPSQTFYGYGGGYGGL